MEGQWIEMRYYYLAFPWVLGIGPSPWARKDVALSPSTSYVTTGNYTGVQHITEKEVSSEVGLDPSVLFRVWGEYN